MKKLLFLLLLIPFSVMSTERTERLLPDSPAWKGYCECMTDDQIYFARHF